MKPGDCLQILFIALKLCGVIDWSWWWVFSPYLFALAVEVAARNV